MAAWFARPGWLWLGLLLPVLGALAGWSALRRRQARSRLVRGPAGARLLPPVGWREGLCFLCWGSGLLALLLACAGPRWGQDLEPRPAGRDLIVVLDLSRSMLAEQPSRLERARQSLADLCRVLERLGGCRLALVVFAAHPRLVCPLTPDCDHVREMLAEQDPAVLPPALRPQAHDPPTGTRLGAALRLAVRLHDPAFRAGTDLVLLSDGDDPARDGEWAEGIVAARTARLPVHVVAIGDPQRSFPIPLGAGLLHYQGQLVQTRLEEEPLRQIAQGTGGSYLPAYTQSFPLGRWFEEVLWRHRLPRTEKDQPQAPEQAVWFYALALALFLLGLSGNRARTDLEKRRRSSNHAAPAWPAWTAGLCALVWFWTGAAAVDTFLRRGNAAYRAKQFTTALTWYQKAEERSSDPGQVAFNEAAALYRLERYREAELHYRRCLEDAVGLRRAQALYNLGNCLVQQAQGPQAVRLLEQASACYRQVLAMPELPSDLAANAAYNLELTRLLWLQARSVSAEEAPPEEGAEGEREDKRHSILSKKENGDASSPPSEESGITPEAPPSGEGKEGAARRPVPGAGNLPVLPDTEHLVRLAPEDTAAYLAQTVTRIRQQRRQAWGQLTPPRPAAKDW
jgi:Ca-activated chloride channel family protein